MSSHYDFTSDGDLSYQFTTESAEKYTCYFTEFFLQNEFGEDIQIYSFGFDRLKSPLDSHNKFDERVKTTIVFIIQEFFKKNPDSVLLYVCMFNDGKAENRHIIFSRWFNESGNNFEKFDSPLTFRQQEFYSSLILLSSNVQKHFLKKAFVLTLNYWMREE